MNSGITILLYQEPTVFPEGGWAGQGNFLSLGWETIREGGWTTSWPTAWRCGKETGILHIIFIFPEKAWNCTSRKKRTSENHINGTLERHPLPQVRTCLQGAYQSTNKDIRRVIWGSWISGFMNGIRNRLTVVTLDAGRNIRNDECFMRCSIYFLFFTTISSEERKMGRFQSESKLPLFSGFTIVPFN